MSRKLARDFFLRPTLEVAPALLGKTLTTVVRGQETSGMIVEVEAYLGKGDDACHAGRGPTKRNQVMFREGGYCYVYLIYGMYYCVNVVTEQAGYGSAVLIRAVEPLSGIEKMHKRRKIPLTRRAIPPYALTNGPGKLCEAMAINMKLSGEDFLRSSIIKLHAGKDIPSKQIASSRRIGITKAAEFEWRFFIKDNPWVGKTPRF